MKHQIITLGRENLSVFIGMKEFSPDMVHFLLTKQTADFHLPLIDMLPNKVDWKTYMVDPYKGESIINACKMIHASIGEENDEFIYNLSEGTKIMSLAALTVAKEVGAKAVYFTQTGEIVDLINFSITPMQTPLSNKEILKLSGSRLWTYLNVKQLPYSDIQTAHKIKDFIEKYPSEYSSIQKFYRYNCHRQIEKIPNTADIDNNLKITINKGRVNVTKKGNPLLNLTHSNSVFLLFGGRWWEAVVSSHVRTWTEQYKEDTEEINNIEAWQSVIFQANSNDEKVKNEIDILINNKNNLIFLECKSGFITQDDVYKMDSVRETYGGDSSVSALASYYPLDPVIKEKCRDLDIKVFAPRTTEERINFINTLPNWLDKITNF